MIKDGGGFYKLEHLYVSLDKTKPNNSTTHSFRDGSCHRCSSSALSFIWCSSNLESVVSILIPLWFFSCARVKFVKKKIREKKSESSFS